MQTKSHALMLLGPTASGKTSIALELADKYPLEIISIDSALVFRHMDIGTAKPTKEERAKVPHHLIDIIEPVETYSVSQFVSDAEKLVFEIRNRGNIPIIVGGTMLYAHALLNGLSPIPPTDTQVRLHVKELLETKGLSYLYGQLSEVDPQTAQRLKPGDTQRITRAVEVYEFTGKPLSSYFAEKKPSKIALSVFGLMPQDRSILHERIEKRFDQMLKDGFLEEVKELRQMPGMHEDLPSMRCVGYRQAWDYLEGAADFDVFRMSAIAATRQLAKRQMTWLRSMERAKLISMESSDSLPEIENGLRELLETK